MIRLIDVVRHDGVRPVLKRINLEIRSGELTVILGPNGMGKTTRLATMAGVLTPQQGVVEIDGLRRRASVEEELEIRKRVVYLPDHPWLPIELFGPVGIAIVLAITLAVGPTYRRWQLTGSHRMVPDYLNKGNFTEL